MFPLTLEVTLKTTAGGFTVQWLSYTDTQWEVKTSQQDSLVELIRGTIETAGKYQNQPFHLDGTTHKWIWYYERFIPSEIKVTDSQQHFAFENRQAMALKTEDYGKDIMRAYVSSELARRVSDYTQFIEISIWVGTFNLGAAGPAGQLSS